MKKNYKYGKLINDRIEYAPYPIKINGYDVYGANEEQYLSSGYKKIVVDYNNTTNDEEIKAVFTQTEKEIKIEYVNVKERE